MKSNKLFIPVFIFFSLLAILPSCTKDFEELNTNPKGLVNVPSGSLFGYAVKRAVDRYTTVSVNNNISPMLAQYFTQVTYVEVSHYDLQRNPEDGMWYRYYVNVLGNLQDAATKNEVSSEHKDVKTNRGACIEIMNVWTWQFLTDMFGDIPYSEALKAPSLKTPKYDTQKDIYDDLFNRLKEVIASIKESEKGFESKDDVIYKGDMKKWKKFANTLMLRMAVRVQGKKSDLKNYPDVDQAIAGMFASSADDAIFPYKKTTPDNHPLYDVFVLSNRFDYISSNTIVDILKSKSDPRISFMVDLPREEGAKEYLGAPFGSNAMNASTQKKYSTIKGYVNSPKTDYHAADLKGIVMTYAEACFLKSELKGNDKDSYIEGVKASMKDLGVADDDINKYTDKLSAPTLEDIITQKYIALYPTSGFEAWTEWRRTSYPTLNQPKGASTAKPIQRLSYPQDEETLNKDNWRKAVENILPNKNDGYDGRVWWDVKDNTLKKQ